MIAIPPGSGETAKIIGIDPGTVNCGVGIVEFNVRTFEIVATDAQTLVGERLHKGGAWMAEAHGERLSRVSYIIDRLVEIFNWVRPLEIVSESPFYSRRRPQAFGALTEFVSMLRLAVWHYDLWMQLTTIDPPSVKIAVGAEVQGGKESVRAAMLSVADTLCWTGQVPLANIGPDAMDGLAIAMWRYLLLREAALGVPMPRADPRPKGKRRVKNRKRSAG